MHLANVMAVMAVALASVEHHGNAVWEPSTQQITEPLPSNKEAMYIAAFQQRVANAGA